MRGWWLVVLVGCGPEVVPRGAPTPLGEGPDPAGVCSADPLRGFARRVDADTLEVQAVSAVSGEDLVAVEVLDAELVSEQFLGAEAYVLCHPTENDVQLDFTVDCGEEQLVVPLFVDDWSTFGEEWAALPLL
ncbi:MAG: hypothetical protein EP330_09635 [Deltaproteobacteria bacterium]|nr:MAG: hypothetical protein EP330_09635 [Deltaproteobacteria bacterium]